MAYPAGFSSDEDEYNAFMSDENISDVEDNAQVGVVQLPQENVPPELTQEEKMHNLFSFIVRGDIAEVRSLLDQGIDLNIDIKDGWTPLLLAASVGDPDIVCELLQRGADINATRNMHTALMLAGSCPETTSPLPKTLNIANQLIGGGINVDAKTKTRKTAFMFAAANGHVEIVRKLLTCCDKNTEDNQGWDALYWAVHDNKPEIVKILLDEGFSLNKIDIRGNTPGNYAISQEFQEIIELLPKRAEEAVLAFNESYQIDTLFQQKSPQFYYDICRMLYGMKCEQLADKFTEVTLLDFLFLNEKKLKELGIRIPYQRNRILIGLHRFHKQVYKQKSIPVVPKDAIYSTIDVADAIVAAIRQLISMQASVRYISHFPKKGEEKLPFHINIIRTKIQKLKKTAVALNSLTYKWDSQLYPADLITKKSRKSSGTRWLTWFVCLSCLTVVSVAVNKVRHL